MGLKPDHWIRKMASNHRMIDPFEEGQVRDGVVSYGVSSYGYDIRVATSLKFSPTPILPSWIPKTSIPSRWWTSRARYA